ncbi:MAG: DUF4919 domain-containing protein [Candidatus Atribacteria bacterium]|nr:DUF4919 domain-containing protein [Candidatus Atribacteria bacterium]
MSYELRVLRFCSSLLVFCMVFVFFNVPGNTQDNPTNSYQALLNRLKNGDTSIDFAELRLLFAQLPDYNPYRTTEELRDKENQMWEAYKNGNYEEALQIGNSILDTNYLRIMPHYIFSEVYEKLGNTEKQQFHEDVFFGLVDSVIKSGDGKSPETAMTVIEIKEEYDVLSVLGFDEDSHTLIEQDGKRFDVITAQNPETGETRDFYFNIDLFYGKDLVSDTSPLENTPLPELAPGTESETFIAPTPMVAIPEPSLTPVTTPTPQTPAFSQPAPSATTIPTTSAPQSLIVNPPPGWIPQSTEDPTQIGYYQLVNQQNIVIAEYIVLLETLPSPLDLRSYFSYIQQNELQPPMFNGYIPQQTIDTSLLGLPALRHDFLFTVDNMQLKAMTIFVILGNNAYSFLFYSSVNDFPNLESNFIQALSTVSLQGATEPQPIPPISPTPPPPATGNWYQHPSGLFSISLPPESVKKQDMQNGVVYTSPNNGEIYLMSFSSETEVQNTMNGLAGGKNYEAETTLNAGNQQALVKIYSFAQNNMNYAMLISSYPGTPVLVIIVVPANQYNASQSWMISTITGIQFR